MNLKSLRVQHKLSQEQVAKMLSVSQSNYSKYEKGLVEPDIKTLVTLANLYNVSLDFLCQRQWNNQIGYVQEERRETVKKIIQLDDKSFNLVDAYIQGLVANEKHN